MTTHISEFDQNMDALLEDAYLRLVSWMEKTCVFSEASRQRMLSDPESVAIDVGIASAWRDFMRAISCPYSTHAHYRAIERWHELRSQGVEF